MPKNKKNETEKLIYEQVLLWSLADLPGFQHTQIITLKTLCDDYGLFLCTGVTGEKQSPFQLHSRTK